MKRVIFTWASFAIAAALTVAAIPYVLLYPNKQERK